MIGKKSFFSTDFNLTRRGRNQKGERSAINKVENYMFKQKVVKQILALSVGITAALQLACASGEKSDRGSNGTDESSFQAIPVETYVIQTGEVVDKVKAMGTIFPVHDVLISSETAGTITEVYVEVGDWVEKGAPLVQIDPELKQLALDQAEARLIEANAAYEKAKKDFERNKKLFETHDISDYVYENARLQKESAEAAYLTARANVKIARRQLKDTRIESPVNGFVAARLVELGGTVAPGTPVAKVVDIRQVKVKFGVPEKDIVKISKGQRAKITLDSYPGETFEGTVGAVGPQADLSTRTFPVEILVENTEYRLKAGMVARVEVATETIQDVPLLPKSALLERSGQTILFVIKQGIAQKRIPQLGLESGDKIALLDGAEAGDEVVILGQENLVDGAKVVVRKKQN
jgi:membrane fusion protein (multidrug efflux system)